MTKDQAINLFGNVSTLAAALGITTQAISQWGELVPELRAYQIRELLAGPRAYRDPEKNEKQLAL